jgi:hypothetical protein
VKPAAPNRAIDAKAFCVSRQAANREPVTRDGWRWPSRSTSSQTKTSRAASANGSVRQSTALASPNVVVAAAIVAASVIVTVSANAGRRLA